MHNGENIIRKRGIVRLFAAVFLLSAGMLQVGIQGVSASEADFFTEEEILSVEEEMPQTDQETGQEPLQAEQAAENPQNGQDMQNRQGAQNGQDIRSGQNIPSGQDARDGQPSANLPDKSGSRRAADTGSGQRGEEIESTKSAEADSGESAGQQFYTPDAAAAAALQSQEAVQAEKTGAAAQQPPQTEGNETEGNGTERNKRQPQTERSETGQTARQPDLQVKGNREDMLFWGMLLLTVGLFSAGIYRLRAHMRANTFMRW